MFISKCEPCSMFTIAVLQQIIGWTRITSPIPTFPTESMVFLQPPMIRNNELGDSVLLFYNFFRDNPEGTPFSAIKIGFTSNLEAITVGGLMLKGCYEKGAHATALAKWRPFCPGKDELTHLALDKWPPFRRRHFQTYFLEWKRSIFLPNFHWSLFICVLLTINQHWFR